MSNMNHKKQKGDVLLESLISLVLMAVIVMGVAVVTTQANKNLSGTKANIYIVNDLKNKLSTRTREDICDGGEKIIMPDESDPDITPMYCDTNLGVTFTIDNEVVVDAPIVMKAPIVYAVKVNGLDYKVGGASR